MSQAIGEAAQVRGPADVTLEDAMEIAVRAQRAEDFDVAREVYERILQAVPDYAPALHFYGILRHQTGRPIEAVRLIRQAIESDPGDAGMHSNLGNVMMELDRPEMAVAAYESAILLDHGSVDARNNLGVAYRALRRVDEAEAVYREAIDLDPKHRDAWDNLGRLLAGRGRIQEAIACHARALELEPRNPGTRRMLVAAYAAAKELPRALQIVRDWLAEEPDNPAAQHLVAALSGENVPERASDIYVEALFDGFASSFDRKLAQLDYRAPELVAQAVAALYPEPNGSLDILDAGCGTGLCGPALKPFARELVGIDLSGKMLDRARERDSYGRLERVELGQFLADHPDSYDLVVSADTLCYFGSLEGVSRAAHGALRPGGAFVFSVEEGGGPDASSMLHPHGRFSHAGTYVERTLAEAGFTAVSVQRDVLRRESGSPVGGLVVTARRS